MVIFRRKLKPKQVERTFQKNRFFNKLKELKLKVGSAALICSKESRMELSQIKRIKHCLKRLVKKRRRGKSKVKRGARSIRKKIWYFGKTYFYLQKKAKNSRMGKGKGNIDRKVLKLNKNFILFEFYGISIYKLYFFVNKINKKLNFKFIVFFKKLIPTPCWFSKKNYSFFYKKYLLY